MDCIFSYCSDNSQYFKFNNQFKSNYEICQKISTKLINQVDVFIKLILINNSRADLLLFVKITSTRKMKLVARIFPLYRVNIGLKT